MRKALFLIIVSTMIPASVDLWLHYHPAPQALPPAAPLQAAR